VAGYISDFFGFAADDCSDNALDYAARLTCPILGTVCNKALGRDRSPAGACAVKQVTASSPEVICCPIRLYADDYKILRIVSERAFKCELNLYSGRVAIDRAREEGGAVAVFGHGWGGELQLPQRDGTGAYSVDWVLARLDGNGSLAEISAIEVQTIDTTGNYHASRDALLADRTMAKSTVGLNWENVSKRILPQIIYKGQVLQREELCRTGLFFVCPQPVYDRVLARLGGKGNLPEFPSGQPGTVHFFSYDYDRTAPTAEGEMLLLAFQEEYCTAIHKVQEAFSNIALPESNVYRSAISKALYGEMRYHFTNTADGDSAGET
jgi:hypothetical protein